MKTICISCDKKFEDVNYKKFYGNKLNVRIFCNECIVGIYQKLKKEKEIKK